ncbi:hypothetical protein ABDZ30_04740 [Aeromonas veronii]|uniref:hypothetical protein n=1 Tax=Aeromonas veronii TaxID=654 RepID=UPI0031FBB958
MDTSPLYLDWQFWSALGTVTAIVLSQLPPVKLWFRPRRLEVEVHSRIQLTHKVGNPNVGMFVNLNNIGGRALQIRSIEIEIVRDGKPLLTLPAQNYFENTASQAAILFVPFFLRPGDSWSHPVIFLNLFDRTDEKFYRESESALKKDIQKKLNTRSKEENELVIAEPELVEPFTKMFNKLFIWNPGEYVIKLSVFARPGNIIFSEKYRFTLFESDAEELKSQSEDYKTGGGISYNLDSHIGVFIPISKHKG